MNNVSRFEVGQSASLSKSIQQRDIEIFAQLSGDDNPIHLDEEYAMGTRFGGRIAHGMLVAGLISAVLGTKLPGKGAIYLSQELKFRGPVRPGDTLTAKVEIIEWDEEKSRMTLTTEVSNQNEDVVIMGTAKMLVEAQPN
ncbi:MAG: MaoC family dehydratase [Candidatus Hydrogenedentes bacterium]|nr:MaoC family dehydratase [Candidatus Hydrogenedentota bacterium]